jgi:class 3 adenylate cyclase/pimeloyl-ACP methyl ester carboxylesterase
MQAIQRPEIQYAMSGDISIAFQVFGRGQQDLLYVPGIISHLETNWEEPNSANFLTALGQHFRVIIFDKRGQGMSDRIEGATTLEERIDDLKAVMQAAGSESATIFALSEGGPVSVLFAATYPQKVERLILFGAMAKFWGTDDYPHMAHIKYMDKAIESVSSNWGKGYFAAQAGPKGGFNPETQALFAKAERMASSPSGVKKFMAANSLIDVRPILSDVKQSTLVIQRRHDQMVRRGNGRYFADNIENATYLELPTSSHLPQFEDPEVVIDAIVKFAHAHVESESRELDRKLSTALFTDIVSSTEKLLKMGDEAWRRMLDQHDAIVGPLVASYKGRIVKNTGDGILAIFDGPVRALQCALELIDALDKINLPIRAGLHVGEVVTRGEDITGIAVNIAARVMDQASSGEVLMTRTLKDLTGGSQMVFESLGEFELKGLNEHFELFRSSGNRS